MISLRRASPILPPTFIATFLRELTISVIKYKDFLWLVSVGVDTEYHLLKDAKDPRCVAHEAHLFFHPCKSGPQSYTVKPPLMKR